MGMRVALVHDWLLTYRGGEKVLEGLCEIFPEADLYTLIYKPGSTSPIIENRKIVTSFLQSIPGIYRRYRHSLPLMPYAIQKFDLSSYDLVISSSHCVAKGIYLGNKKTTSKKPLHICYCHTPMRYIWDQYEDYFGPLHSSLLTRAAAGRIRKQLQAWDKKTADHVNYFIANSENVKDRIRRFYGRDAEVIYPPVDLDFYGFEPENSSDSPWGYYLIVTTFVPYKKTELAVQTFNRLKLPLKIIGTGPEERMLRRTAGPFVEFLGWQPDEIIRWHYGRAKALLFPGEEDFGIVPVEAQAAGCPVIAYGKGGALETVREGKSGLFFNQQTPEALEEAVRRFQTTGFDRREIRNGVLRFHKKEFARQIRRFVQSHH